MPNMKSDYFWVVSFFPSLYFSVFCVISKENILLLYLQELLLKEKYLGPPGFNLSRLFGISRTVFYLYKYYNFFFN